MFASTKRHLTVGEQAMVASVFGAALDCTPVYICRSWWVLPNYAFSPNGSIYFNKRNYVADFALQNVAVRAWFMHEMTHVWQVQQGVNVLRRAIMDRRYAYVLAKGAKFAQFGIEQQAQMVQDYYYRKHTAQECDSLRQCLPFDLDV